MSDNRSAIVKRIVDEMDKDRGRLMDIVRAVDGLYAASGDPQDVGIEKTFELVQAAMWRKLDAVSLADAAK